MKRYLPTILLLLSAFGAISNPSAIILSKLSREEYIKKYAQLAIQEMVEYKIPASITMAQACLESMDGNSVLTKQSNNHFGIKCKSDWTGPTVYHKDDAPNECFRKYDSAEESFRDHSQFLTSGSRYGFLFTYEIKDYQKWAYGLKQAGYATDPAYPSKLIKIVEDFHLYELDQEGAKYAGADGQKGSRGTLFGFLHKKPGSKSSSESQSANERTVERRNWKKAIIAIPGDDYAAIATAAGLTEAQLLTYNDATAGEQPEPGEPVYLQTKRIKGQRSNKYHQFREGENLRSIAQWYGIRLESLRYMNRLATDEEPKPGVVLSLRKKIREPR